jgi:hypothetical protein
VTVAVQALMVSVMVAVPVPSPSIVTVTVSVGQAGLKRPFVNVLAPLSRCVKLTSHS